MATVFSKYVWPAVKGQLEVFSRIWDFLIGERRYAIVMNVRGTRGCQLSGVIFHSKAAASMKARSIGKSRSFMHIENVRLYDEYEAKDIQLEPQQHRYYVNVFQEVRYNPETGEDYVGESWLSCNIFRDLAEAHHHASHMQGRSDAVFQCTLSFVSDKEYKPIEESYALD